MNVRNAIENIRLSASQKYANATPFKLHFFFKIAGYFPLKIIQNVQHKYTPPKHYIFITPSFMYVINNFIYKFRSTIITKC